MLGGYPDTCGFVPKNYCVGVSHLGVKYSSTALQVVVDPLPRVSRLGIESLDKQF
jgi:hypothetical protein